jgi:tetratricopeptide (TPR) repeat protein
MAAGATALAESLLEGIEVAAARDRHGVETARAVLAEMQGRVEEALGLYVEVAERWTEFEFVLEQGQALLGAGRCLLALGRSAEAAPRLERARRLFGGLGAIPLAAEAAALLEQATAPRS